MGLVPIKPKPKLQPTKYQQAVYDFIRNGEGHAVVNAVAGSGKTTTLCEAVSRIPHGKSYVMLAFNKHIAEELKKRGMNGMTLHSMGMRVCNNQLPARPSVDGDKMVKLLDLILNMEDPDNYDAKRMIGPAAKLIGLMKAFGYGALDDRPMPTDAELGMLASKYGVEIPDEVDESRFFKVVNDAFQMGITQTGRIDFDDMLYFPMKYKLTMPTFDYVFVDESQDLNPIQIALVKQLVRKRGRAIFVGDRHQAIYGFRGADPDAIDTVVRDFEATELPLSICFRCPRTVIVAAQQIVPHIETFDGAPEGLVYDIEHSKLLERLVPGDYVLCRTTAPLVGWCLKCIGAGKKATVKGRDIGQGLIALVRKVDKIAKFSSMPIALKISTYIEEQVAKLDIISKPWQLSKKQALEDKSACLTILADDCNNAAELMMKIESIFTDDVQGIIFCTAHRSKGLETDRVYVIRPELMPLRTDDPKQYQQELNLKYVTITRAKKELVWVLSPRD